MRELRWADIGTRAATPSLMMPTILLDVVKQTRSDV